jgi:succinate dehydrogenase hydrophobic anchor subunit
VQELSDVAIQWPKGPRYKYRARDNFWHSKESKTAKELIANELGHEVASVDDAYDFCLTRVSEHFQKRYIFIARYLVSIFWCPISIACRVSRWSYANAIETAVLLVIAYDILWHRWNAIRALKRDEQAEKRAIEREEALLTRFFRASGEMGLHGR